MISEILNYLLCYLNITRTIVYYFFCNLKYDLFLYTHTSSSRRVYIYYKNKHKKIYIRCARRCCLTTLASISAISILRSKFLIVASNS